MRRALFWCASSAVALLGVGACSSATDTLPVASAGAPGQSGGAGQSGAGGASSLPSGGRSSGGTAAITAGATGVAGSPSTGGTGPLASCKYTDDVSFCSCMGWDCGGKTLDDSTGAPHTVYCGTCTGGEYCQNATDVGYGKCGGKNPLLYDWQRQKIGMLVAMGENDNTDVNYGYAENIHDDRGYTVGIVGFCTGTGDFIEVAQCYNTLKPGNVLAKYWGHRDASGKAIDGLVYYEDQFLATGVNQGDTSKIDSLAAGSSFVADCATAGNDPEYRACQNTMADAFYMATALRYATAKGLQGALTIGFIYDTELNFGDGDESSAPGTKTVIARADADYGANMPTDFTGKPWEESKWLGYLIKERTIVMSKDDTWNSDMDQNATWEAARRLHTAPSNNPESATDLSMTYDIVSKYKAGSSSAGTPCWPTGLSDTTDSQSSIYLVATDKSVSATDQTKWTATSDSGGDNYVACPSNPTP